MDNGETMIIPVQHKYAEAILIPELLPAGSKLRDMAYFMEDNKINNYLSKYLSFVAPFIHQDTKEFYDYSIVRHKIKDQSFNLKPYSIVEFIDTTLTSDNFNDMENYTSQVIEDFRNNLN